MVLYSTYKLFDIVPIFKKPFPTNQQIGAEWPKKPLNFTDCTLLAYMELENIEFFVTFDNEFNGLVNIVKI
ncbi:MAG: hypothetical protein ACFE95_21185 [Candidatus Hodarchaeota archaeon]